MSAKTVCVELQSTLKIVCNPPMPKPLETAGLPTPPFLSAGPDGALLAVKLQPRASINEIGEALRNELRIKVTAPPVDAAANEALVRLLADKLDWPRNRIELM